VTNFRFYCPIEVRYGDLDPQGHLNNAKYLTFMEQARIHYLKHLGLWHGGSFLDIGIILAQVQVDFLAPVELDCEVKVGVCVTRLGTKSLDMAYLVCDAENDREYARGTSVQVAYDYHLQISIPIPADWREVIQNFEQLENGNSV